MLAMISARRKKTRLGVGESAGNMHAPALLVRRIGGDFLRLVRQSVSKVSICMTFDPAISLLGTVRRELESVKLYFQGCSLDIMVTNWKQPKYA